MQNVVRRGCGRALRMSLASRPRFLAQIRPQIGPCGTSSFSSTSHRSLPEERGKGDRVVYETPFEESAGINPAEQYKEATTNLHEYGQYLMSICPKFIQQFSIYKDELTLFCAPIHIHHLSQFLRDHSTCQFKSIMDITAVDYPTRDKRFEVVYNFLSTTHNARIRVKTYADEVTPVPSLVSLFNGANWYEREVYDMFGIFFDGHPDLRRILTDYGFEGHPLRKDFPLTGYYELRYDEEKKRVVQEPLELAQAFRNFEGTSPWEQVGSGRDARPEQYKLGDGEKK